MCAAYATITCCWRLFFIVDHSASEVFGATAPFACIYIRGFHRRRLLGDDGSAHEILSGVYVTQFHGEVDGGAQEPGPGTEVKIKITPTIPVVTYVSTHKCMLRGAA